MADELVICEICGYRYDPRPILPAVEPRDLCPALEKLASIIGKCNTFTQEHILMHLPEELRTAVSIQNEEEG